MSSSIFLASALKSGISEKAWFLLVVEIALLVLVTAARCFWDVFDSTLLWGKELERCMCASAHVHACTHVHTHTHFSGIMSLTEIRNSGRFLHFSLPAIPRGSSLTSLFQILPQTAPWLLTPLPLTHLLRPTVSLTALQD